MASISFCVNPMFLFGEHTSVRLDNGLSRKFIEDQRNPVGCAARAGRTRRRAHGGSAEIDKI